MGFYFTILTPLPLGKRSVSTQRKVTCYAAGQTLRFETPSLGLASRSTCMA